MPRIEVVKERCKACGYCIKFCPKECLALGTKVNAKGYEYVVSVKPENCVGCAICGQVCPDGAINVYR